MNRWKTRPGVSSLDEMFSPIQDRYLTRSTVFEMAGHVTLHITVAALCYGMFGFEVALLAVLAIGFSLVATNIAAGATASGVLLAEIRNIGSEAAG